MIKHKDTNDPPTVKQKYVRKIRSFVRRKGRMTHRQQTAIQTLWSEFGVDYQTSLIDFSQLFKNDNPVVLEIGFGMGKSLVEMAKSAPEKNFLGIEVHESGVGACLADLSEEGITNLRLINHDAVEVLQFMIPDNSLSTFQLYFPDPWHKTRHNKRRIVQTKFIEDMHKKVMIYGIIHMATDWKPYAEHMLTILNDVQDLQNCSQTAYAPRPDWRPLTKFECRGNKLGHGVWDLLFKRVR